MSLELSPTLSKTLRIVTAESRLPQDVYKTPTEPVTSYSTMKHADVAPHYLHFQLQIDQQLNLYLRLYDNGHVIFTVKCYCKYLSPSREGLVGYNNGMQR